MDREVITSQLSDAPLTLYIMLETAASEIGLIWEIPKQIGPGNILEPPYQLRRKRFMARMVSFLKTSVNKF